jgi:hypothetical protein
VDVGSGNALFTDRLFTLPGVTADVPINLYYNSSVVGHGIPSSVTGTSNSGWSITGFDQRLIANSDGSVTYLGPGGLTGVFAPDGAGGFTPPVQFRADLATVSGGGWKMTVHATGEVLIFSAGGRLSQDKDRNGNITAFNYSSGLPASVVSSRGANPQARTLTVMTGSGVITGLSQSDGSQTRTVSFDYDISAGLFLSVTDTLGGITAFGSSAGGGWMITNPDGASTTVSYSSNKVTRVEQSNTATGSPARRSPG